MDTELDSTLSEQEAPADPVQPDQEDAKADPQDVDYKKRYADLKKDYDKIVTERKEVKPVVEDTEVDWKIENASRLKLVKDEYNRHLAEMQADGAKLTPALRERALKLAELDKGILKSSSSEADRQAANSSPAASTLRNTSPSVEVTEHDKRFNIDAKRKKELQEKYPDLLEEV